MTFRAGIVISAIALAGCAGSGIDLFDRAGPCVPRLCAGACGSVDDGCGGVLECGCLEGSACDPSTQQCRADCAPDAPIPLLDVASALSGSGEPLVMRSDAEALYFASGFHTAGTPGNSFVYSVPKCGGTPTRLVGIPDLGDGGRRALALRDGALHWPDRNARVILRATREGGVLGSWPTPAAVCALAEVTGGGFVAGGCLGTELGVFRIGAQGSIGEQLDAVDPSPRGLAAGDAGIAWHVPSRLGLLSSGDATPRVVEDVPAVGDLEVVRDRACWVAAGQPVTCASFTTGETLELPGTLGATRLATHAGRLFATSPGAGQLEIPLDGSPPRVVGDIASVVLHADADGLYVVGAAIGAPDGTPAQLWRLPLP